jgi:hypothetical protein
VADSKKLGKWVERRKIKEKASSNHLNAIITSPCIILYESHGAL